MRVRGRGGLIYGWEPHEERQKVLSVVSYHVTAVRSAGSERFTSAAHSGGGADGQVTL